MKLESGMVIYAKESLPTRLVKYVVERVTEKQAVVKQRNYEIRFDREIRDNAPFYQRGRTDGYSRTAYFVETDELKEKYLRQCLEAKYSRIDVKKLNDVQLREILSIALQEQP